MTEFVLDCSVAIAWVFDDQASDATDALLRDLQDGGRAAGKEAVAVLPSP